MWRHSISTWRHEVTELTIHILACRCAIKMILFLFPWYFESLSSNMLLISHLCDVMTSWHHVMTSQNLIYLSQLVDVLESWFFLCFHGFLGHSLSSKMLLIFYLCDAVTSWRHVMTSLNLIYLSQLVDVLESWFFFCFHGFLGHWVQKCYWFFICVTAVTSWRHVMTSQKLFHLSQVVDLLERWSFSWFKNVIVFLVGVIFWKCLSVHVFVGWYQCHNVTSWRHVMTSRQYLASPYSTYLSCSWAILRFLFKFYANLGCWYQTNHRYYFCKLPPACHNVASWRHDVTSCHRMKLKQY